jgi:transcriptional regulator GlxA family with amidase domain
MSSRQLERLFKACTGQSPQNYARSLRLRAATWLLTNSGKSISHIATACGFSDASHLGREFRKITGRSPKVFREQNPMTLEDAGLFTVLNDSPAVTNYHELFPARTEFH